MRVVADRDSLQQLPAAGVNHGDRAIVTVGVPELGAIGRELEHVGATADLPGVGYLAGRKVYDRDGPRRLEALYVVAVTTGLRQGELLGLKWDDVDMEAGTLQVRRTLTTAKGGPVLSPPKTKGSRRTVKLSPTALEAVRSHLARQLEEIDRVGSLWRENSLIFASEVGEPLDRRALTTHRFKPLLERAGLPQIRFHDQRHTCATLLLSKNVNPKVVSEMLGHATIAITLDTYSHVLHTMQESAAKAMEEALS
jgi:integrase